MTRSVDMCLTLNERKSVVVETANRYQKADKKQKAVILNEFIQLTGLTRHHSSYLLRSHGKKVRYKKVTFQGDVRKAIRHKRPPIYDKELVKILVTLWKVSGHLCGKRLKPFIKDNIDSIKKNLHPSLKQSQLLEKISAATIDRLLTDEREKYKIKKGRSTTKAGNLKKAQIPIRTFADWDEKVPGFFEIDLVSHDGGVYKGDFCYTLNATDVNTGWVVLRAIKNKAQIWTLEALDSISRSIPFKLQGIDSDNGSEFINAHFIEYCQKNHITFTRARPYRKNDNCFVEQKNYSVARKTVGYFRYEEDALMTLNGLYTQLSFLTNYFQPSMKLISKERIGSKIKKKYDVAKTPYQKLMESDAPQGAKDRAKALKDSLDLFQLRIDIDMYDKRLSKKTKKL